MSDKYKVAFDQSFDISLASTSVDLLEGQDKKYFKKCLKKEVKKISALQELLYAHDKHSVLLVFQAMDAAGKDSTIRAVMTGINPAGCQVSSFKKPSALELDQDFLWRTTCKLPQRGRIGVFNRSYYEDVLVVKVHPELLDYAKLPCNTGHKAFWPDRYESIRHYESHLERNGTVILKFWLNVSLQEQAKRFLSRLNTPEKLWKFSANDMQEREYWDDYMQAYEDALNATSRPYAPWYAIPADNKPYMRYCIARLIRKRLSALVMSYPTVSEEDQVKYQAIKESLTL
jgi:PPK2 family polyphosphate:nucleotide phosphotransferase